MWYHPLAETRVERARKAWEEAGAAFLMEPNDAATAAAERRARARYEAALREAGLTPLLPHRAAPRALPVPGGSEASGTR